ncbi:PQQ-binding-like beta-propeller repeat protein [Actinomadura sp. HBU206391]|uniref:outer membrane protein assembly factor BamB family protein n=1 Tax=Actinomadura sp. HBU206391 TaxID=2731692 RepID=UPI00164F6D35|nr:PQQ-binding-like beta-propeller repeat protein [Actinomadura sp. HBU206391]MBC6458186.1 PQQ-binding-like beta-propeller repeat protein [Actinomadura sp. HBU206391]
MIGGRQRHVLSLVAVVLAVTTAAVLINRFVLQAEWWQVDQKVTDRPAGRLADLGPPPGPVALTWQLPTAVRRSGLSPYDQVAHGVVQGQVVVVSGRGLDVRDARTGAERWHYNRSDWTLLGWAATGGHLLAYFERAGHRGDRLIAGFDAVSGRLLWRAPGEAPAVTERSSLRWPAGSGVVLTTDTGRRSLRGRSAATGKRLWTTPLPRGCELPDATAHGSGGSETLSVLSLDCDRHGRVLAIDPATGRTLWSRTLRPAEPPAVTVDGDVTAVFDGDSLRAYRRDGKEIAARLGDDLCGAMCPVVLSGDRLIMVYRQGDDRAAARRMEAIEVSSGRTVWQHDVPDYAALTVSGDRLYALRPRLAENLLPAGIDIVAPADGETTTVPAPFVVGPRMDGARPWLAAAGGLLYVAVPEVGPRQSADERRDPYPAGAARLIALRGGPGGHGPDEFGGVATADWPDACGLLRKSDLAAVRTGRYRTRPERTSVGDVPLPRPVSCRYEPDDDKGQSARALTVTVEWVAGTPQAATELLAAWRATEPLARQLMDGGDEAYEFGTSGTIAVRVGRYIVAVNAYQTPGVANRLARAVAARLPAPT